MSCHYRGIVFINNNGIQNNKFKHDVISNNLIIQYDTYNLFINLII